MLVNTYTIPENKILHKTSVDFASREIKKPIHLVQYDKELPIIEVSLYLNKEPYVIPDDFDVKMRWNKNDRTFSYKNVLGCDVTRTKVYFDVDEQMTYFHGKCDPIIELYFPMENGEYDKAGSSSIPVIIDRNPIQETDIESFKKYIDFSNGIIVSDKEPEITKPGLVWYNHTTPALFVSFNDGEQDLWLQIGAGGGGGGISIFRFNSLVPLQSSILFGDEYIVRVSYEHNNADFGTLTIKRNNIVVDTRGVSVGELEIDLTEYIRQGSNIFSLEVTDGNLTRSITYTLNALSINVSTTFDDSINYGSEVVIPFRVESLGERVVTFSVDGVTETFTVNTANNNKILSNLTHGVKEVEIQASTTVDGITIYSEKLYLNIIVVTENHPVLISSKFNTTEITRGFRLNIDYVVFNPLSEFTQVEFLVDDVVVGTTNADRRRGFWSISNLEEGTRSLKISAGGQYVEKIVEVLPTEFIFENVEDDFLKIFFSTYGKNNTDNTRNIWENGYGEDISVALSSFNFRSNGWVDNALVLDGLAEVIIPFKPFENPVGLLGKTIEVEFETTFSNTDLEFIKCFYNGRGFQIFSNRASLSSNNTKAEVFFKENERVKISFVIDKQNMKTLLYINGVMSGVDYMGSATNFQQNNPQNIDINTNHIDGKIFNIRIYDRALDHHEVLQNYLYDKESFEDKITESVFSDIFDENGEPSYEKIKKRMPVMVIRTYSTDTFGNRMPETGDFRPFVSVSYEHNMDPSRNFSYSNVRFRTQGTSTLVYPVKNYRLYDGDLNTNPFIPWEPNQPEMNRINLKADYMESSLSNDPVLAYLFDQMYNEPIPPKALDGKSRTTIWTGGTVCLWHDDGVNKLQFWGVYNLNGDKGDLRHWGHYPGNGFTRSKRFEVNFNASNHAVAFVRNPNLTEQQFLEQLYEGFEPQPQEIYTPEMFAELKDFVLFVSNSDYETPQGREEFRQEFSERASVEYFVKYLIAIMVFGSVDQFGKDMLLNIWDDGTLEKPKWWIVMYDMDSVLGIDNQGRMRDSEGNLLFDYNMEMEDVGVFAQAESKLWEGIFKCFNDEIIEYYGELRQNLFSYDNIWKALSDYIGTVSKGMYNAHAIQRYLDADGASDWYWMMNGDRLNQINRWITYRLAFLDSKYDFNTDTNRLVARLEIENTDNIQFKVKTIIHQWVTGQLGNANAGRMKTRGDAGEVITLNHSYISGTGLPFVELSIFASQYITELIEWDSLPLVTMQLGSLNNLQRLDLSKDTPSLLLQNLTFGDNKELLYLNLRNNTGLSGILDLSLSTRLKELDLRGTSLNDISLPYGGVLEEVYLPGTIKNLSIINQAYLDFLYFESNPLLETLVIENSPMDYRSLLPYLEPNGNVRVIGLEMEIFGLDILREIRIGLDGRGGIDSLGNLTNKPVIQGNIKVLYNEPIDHELIFWFEENLTDLKIETINIYGFSFVYENETLYISEYLGSEIGLLELPKTTNIELNELNNFILGKSNGWMHVEGIKTEAFKNLNSMESIFINSNIKYAEQNSFWNLDSNVILEVEDVNKKETWNDNWHGNFNGHLLFGVSLERTFEIEFDSLGGSPVDNRTGRYFLDRPVSEKLYHSLVDWIYDGSAVSFPFVPDKNGPSHFILQADWFRPTIEVRYINDGIIHYTQNVLYGESLGEEFNSIPIPDNPDWFLNWVHDGDIVDQNFIFLPDVNGELIINIEADFHRLIGMKFVYDSTNDVYDMVSWSPEPSRDFPNGLNQIPGSIDIIVPEKFDDNVNGLKDVRNINITQNDSFIRSCLGNLTISSNSQANRTFSSTNYGYVNMSSLIIPEGFTSISVNSLRGTTNLESIILPNSLTSIGSSAFRNSGIKNMTIPNNVSTIHTDVFRDSSLESINMGNNITTIMSGAFMNCVNLISFVIPIHVNIINSDTFNGCVSLENIDIHNNVTRLNSRSFRGCTSLGPEFTIPESINIIEDEVFMNCSNITSIFLSPIIPPTLTNVNAFSNIGQNKVFWTRNESFDSYISAVNWDFYQDYIQTEIINYLTFINEDGGEISVTPRWTQSGVQIQYSFDTVNWITTTSNIEINRTDGNEIYFRGRATSLKSLFTSFSDLNNSWIIPNTTKIVGNLNFLLCDEFGSNEAPNYLHSNCYANMFNGCTSLTQAPDLPATSLEPRCYENMFRNCTSLTQAPSLPATSLESNCYHGMFRNCTSLTQAPNLPATSLAWNCYQFMFNSCTSLTQAPDLPATSLEPRCYEAMFQGCTSLTQAPNLPATSLAWNCYQFMFNGCTSLTQAPNLPATSVPSDCYRSMFQNCTSLTDVPDLPATSLSSNCYNSMFRNCTSLTQAPDLPATSLNIFCYRQMFQGCTSLTQAPSLPATSLPSDCYRNMFQDCTSLTQAPILPATSLNTFCYAGMFLGCTSLTQAPSLPATSLEIRCYQAMFQDCTSLTQAPILPATSVQGSCYRQMFQGCTSLTQAPDLPATSLNTFCYASMFQNCTSLTDVPDLPATDMQTSCYSSMFRDCSNVKIAPFAGAGYHTTWRIPTSGTLVIANNWNSGMLIGTGGIFTGDPTANVTYWKYGGSGGPGGDPTPS